MERPLRRFFDTPDSDYDYRLLERTFVGRMTKKRYQLLRAYTRSTPDRAPYGISPAGYAYTCGCEHDCCGHLVSESMALIIEPEGNLFKITIKYLASFNY